MIFGAHGFTQDTEEHNRNTRMRALGEANDYVVVHLKGNPVRACKNFDFGTIMVRCNLSYLILD